MRYSACARQACENIRMDIAYDSLGRRDFTTDPLGRVTKYSYDEDRSIGNDNVYIMQTAMPQNDDNQRNIVTSYDYDSLGRQVKVTDTFDRVSLNCLR